MEKTIMMMKKVFVSGCFDVLHSGHIEFLYTASTYGDLYVGIGSDETIWGYKHHVPTYSEKERLFMIRSIKYVKEAYINQGSGIMDFIPTVDIVQPDILIVNTDGDYIEKKEFCEKRGIEYIVLERTPHDSLPKRTSSIIKESISNVPVRLDIAGGWLDQPMLNSLVKGWVITLCLEPTFKIEERSGLSTSTRKAIQDIWSLELPNINSETLSYIAFCLENAPSSENRFISGAQDAIGICTPSLSRHLYDSAYWPSKIEKCNNEEILLWLEQHLCLIFIEARDENYLALKNTDITSSKIQNLVDASEKCWNAIQKRDLEEFAKYFLASFNSQTSMFPSMITPNVQKTIEKYSKLDDVLGWKLSGAGGGGYLICVVNDIRTFSKKYENVIPITIKREV